MNERPGVRGSSFISHRSSFSQRSSNFLLRFPLKCIQNILHAKPPLFDIAVTRHDHRLAVQEDRAREWHRDDHAVPGAQQFFFFAAKATGTMGSPVACAATTTPSFATRAGPFGPSGEIGRAHV